VVYVRAKFQIKIPYVGECVKMKILTVQDLKPPNQDLKPPNLSDRGALG
jgi:hypothetical protein